MTTGQEKTHLKEKDSRITYNNKLDVWRIFKKGKHLKKDHNREESESKTFEKALAAFDTDQTTKSFLKIIELLVDDEETINLMLRLANQEEFHELQAIDEYKKKLKDIIKTLEGIERDSEHQVSKEGLHEKLAMHHIKHALPINQKGFQNDFNELQKTFEMVIENIYNEIEKAIKDERDKARRLFAEKQRFRDASFYPFMVIYLNIRRDSKESLREAKHIKKLESHVKGLRMLLSDYMAAKDEKMQERKLDKFHHGIKEANRDLKDLKKELLDEVENLAHIETFLFALAKREENKIEDLQQTLRQLKEKNYPNDKLLLMQQSFQKALDGIDKLHRRERQQSRALGRAA